MRRVISALLFLIMLSGLPAAAAGGGSGLQAGQLDAIALEVDGAAVQEETAVYTADSRLHHIDTEMLPQFFAMKEGAQITASNVGTDPSAYLCIFFRVYTKSDEPTILTVAELAEDGTERYIQVDFQGKYLDSGGVWYLSAQPGTEGNSIPAHNG